MKTNQILIRDSFLSIPWPRVVMRAHPVGDLLLDFLTHFCPEPFARLDQRPADDAAEDKPLFFDVTIVLVVPAAVVAALVPMQLDFLPVISLAGIALESVVA